MTLILIIHHEHTAYLLLDLNLLWNRLMRVRIDQNTNMYIMRKNNDKNTKTINYIYNK